MSSQIDHPGGMDHPHSNWLVIGCKTFQIGFCSDGCKRLQINGSAVGLVFKGHDRSHWLVSARRLRLGQSVRADPTNTRCEQDQTCQPGQPK